MSIQLKNDNLCLELNKPGKVYQGSRFDWTGQIVQITYLGKHTFCTKELKDEKFYKTQGQGLYNEFGIDMPVGYDACRPCDQFPKIGVGLLTKKYDIPYDFFNPYQIDPFQFTYTKTLSNIIFRCQSNSYGDYAFGLEKVIKLDKSSFSISYTLKNTGKKVILTNEYVHNFLSINNRPIDGKYKLFFSFQLYPNRFENYLNPNDVVQFSKSSLTWKSVPKSAFFFSKLNTDYRGSASWLLVQVQDKVAIRESVNFKIQKMNLWGEAHVVSPEIFALIHVRPGKSYSWKRKYEFFTV